MRSVETTRVIKAPIETVFQTIADVQNFQKAVKGITNIEFLSDQTVGAGTRFRETRIMHGKESTVELEVTEYLENDGVRMVSDAGGTIWDTIFTVREENDTVVMHMKMDAKPYKLGAKLITPWIMGMVTKAIESDMDEIVVYCERLAKK